MLGMTHRLLEHRQKPMGNVLEFVHQENVGVDAAHGIAAEIGRADVDLGLVVESQLHNRRFAPGPAKKMPRDQRTVLDGRQQAGFTEHVSLFLAWENNEDMDAGMLNRQAENGVHQKGGLLHLAAGANDQLVRLGRVRRAQVGPTVEVDWLVSQPDKLCAEFELVHGSGPDVRTCPAS